MKKHFLVILSSLLIILVMLSGCTINSSSEAEEIQQTKDTTDTAQEQIDTTINNPNATPQEILDALATAQGLGIDTEKIDAEATALLKKWVMDILNNQNSTTEMLLYALGVAQMMGLDSDTMYNNTINKINLRIQEEMKDPNLCKNRLLEIATLAQQLGFKEIADVALNRAELSSEKCGYSQLTYTYDESSNGGSRVISAKATGGVLTLYAPGGFTMPEGTSHFFNDGKLEWQYKEVFDNGCAVVTREESGTEDLKTIYDSLFYLDNDGKYQGGVSVNVKLTVTTVKNPPPPGEDDPCPDTKNETHIEDDMVQFNISGVTTNMKQLNGSESDSENSEDFSWNKKTTWDIKLGN